VPGDDAITRDDLIGHPEVEAAVCDELVDLFEGAGVEQQVDALAHRQFPGRALPLEALFAASQLGKPFELLQLRAGIQYYSRLIRRARLVTFPSP
jgi:hypothetical protein